MNELEHFSLRWNNFHSNMSSGFCALLQEDALVDVTLAAEGRILQAHKLVLSVCSPYFKQLFAANPCKHPIVILKDVHHKQLSDLLNFMYQGEVNVRQEELATFLKTAELLQIKGLTEQEPQSGQSHTSHGPFRDERQLLATPRSHAFPKSRQGPVRRVRHSEKPLPLATLSTDARSSPAPSPPPSKRIRPSASPTAANDDNDKQDEAKDAPGNEELENENTTVHVKMEPSSDFEGRHCSNARTSQREENESALGEKDDSVLRKAVSFQSLQTPLSPRGSTQETEDSITNRTPQRLPSEVSASAAGSSGISITPSESSNAAPDNEQGTLVPQYVHSRKGGLQLVLDGFLYTVHQQQGRNKYWRCVERGKLGCQGYCKTFMLEEGEVVQRLRSHNHGRQEDKIRERINATRLRMQILNSLYQQKMAVPNTIYPAPSPNAS